MSRSNFVGLCELGDWIYCLAFARRWTLVVVVYYLHSLICHGARFFKGIREDGFLSIHRCDRMCKSGCRGEGFWDGSTTVVCGRPVPVIVIVDVLERVLVDPQFCGLSMTVVVVESEVVVVKGGPILRHFSFLTEL